MMRRVLCWLGIHHAHKDMICLAWDIETDTLFRWRVCSVCNKQLDFIELH